MESRLKNTGFDSTLFSDIILIQIHNTISKVNNLMNSCIVSYAILLIIFLSCQWGYSRDLYGSGNSNFDVSNFAEYNIGYR